MNKIDISIIIVNYNVKDFSLQCLRSIEKASLNLSVETIVIDNNSQDGSINFLKPLFPNVKFIPLDENIGFGKANNIGIKQAGGEYILILNPDTLLDENTLKIMHDYMNQNSDVGMSGCKVLNADGTFQLGCRRGFPTPWASFCKLFGLQSFFPKSELFAQYNQTFRNIDETYNIDAIIGAFMFTRRQVFHDIGMFDPDFFMYGEDLDLCYRTWLAGWKITYLPTTSIIHYKGESSRRSSANDLKHFYDAMEIYARKHYAKSGIFLLFLKIGIIIRLFISNIQKNKSDILIIILDLIAVNFSLIISTKLRFGHYFNFPSYAYPTVFIVITLIILSSMFAVGEYFEGKHSVIKSFLGLMISFFILSSLTYFFNEYAFSRVVILMTICLSIIITTLTRLFISLLDKYIGKESDKKIAIVGINAQTVNLIHSIQFNDSRNANIIGLINTKNSDSTIQLNLPILGNLVDIANIIEQKKLVEIIITDKSITTNELLKIISSVSNFSVRFHIVEEYEELLAARIISEISGNESTLELSNLTKFRFRLIKRTFDIVVSLFLLTIGFPLLYLTSNYLQIIIKKLKLTLLGQYSFIGLYPINHNSNSIGKIGVIGLAHIARTGKLSDEAIKNLNDYYIKHWTLSLDIEIFLKFLFRKKNAY